MTDIGRHLPGILKLIGQHSQQIIEAGKQELTNADFTVLRDRVTEYLPDSYGVGAGIVVDQQGKRSEMIHLLVYDRILAGNTDFGVDNIYPAFPILAVFDLAIDHTHESMAIAVDTIRSVKNLGHRNRPSVPLHKSTGQSVRKIPKDRLPLGVIYCQQLQAENLSVNSLCATLHYLINSHSQADNPDFVHIIASGILFRNPLLDDDPLTGFETGLSRQPRRVKPHNCYICKTPFYERHFFYDFLCSHCGDLNYAKRLQTADLKGKIALVTGARIKIGYAVVLKLLRAGAQVIAVTRFPRDAARRYAQESDFPLWSERLHLFGLDLRYSPDVEAFAERLQNTYPQLDVLINNAAQTIRQPPSYYAPLRDLEFSPLAELPASVQGMIKGDNQRLLTGSSWSPLLPAGDDNPRTIRAVNSWLLKTDEITLSEMLEVQLVNVTTPFILMARLKSLMQRGSGHKFVINVSASEGQFDQNKRGAHPHTNMAKASLNMLTHTVAEGYAEDGIFVNSVDPGWVSNQIPTASDAEQQALDALLPLDMDDAAARICDPIFTSLNKNQSLYGQLLKNYFPSAW